MYTIEEAKAWAAERSESLDKDRLGHPDQFVQMMNRTMPTKSKALWDSGCWLAAKLRENGASDEQVSGIQMAQGQRSFRGDAWKVAVDYANEFSSTGDTEEKGGEELAEKRHEELFGKPNCRRCSECEGMEHHWIDNSDFGDDEEAAETESATEHSRICKHCEVLGDECPDCDGDGYSREPSLGDEPCKRCKGEGVVLVQGSDQ